MAVVGVARYVDVKGSVTYIRTQYQRVVGFECGRDAQP
jgi:hypothetical protein